MLAPALDRAAHDAVASACARVEEATDGDAVDGVAAGVVARPDDVAQVAEVLRAASAHGLSVVPRGRGTKTSWALPPRAADVVLDLSALDRVLDHAAGDLIVAAEAGATLAEVRRVVADGGQRLTLDETVPGASVGGTLATNASGARRVVVGTARDLLIGVTMVRADGVVAKAGGRVVKNVAGYDVGKLLVGSFGTLAVVVDATFRLHPLPAATRWVGVDVTGPDDADRVVQAVVHSQVVPAAVEIGWAGGTGRVDVLLEGRPDGVAGRASRLCGLLGPAASESDEAPADGATYPWDTTATGDDRRTALKTAFALSGLADVLRATDDAGATVRGSAGAGVLYAALPAGVPAADAAAAVEIVRAACLRHGGSTVVVDAPTAVKSAVDVWGPVPALDLMRRVKDELDPGHLLAPGRFVGGI